MSRLLILCALVVTLIVPSKCFVLKTKSRIETKFGFSKEIESKSSYELKNNGMMTGDAIERLGGVESKNTVWVEFQRISEKNEIIANLGQGFPNWKPPPFCLEALVETVMESTNMHSNPHQYTRTAGHPKLVKELAKRYSIHLKRDIDCYNDVAVTVGASQALFLSLQSLIKEGDEVIVFEPFFDLYINQIKLAGGIPVFVPLTFRPYDEKEEVCGGEWVLERHVLEEKITKRTRAILLNSPHNPTGKVFTHEEMMFIVDVINSPRANEHCVVLSDEVYKYIIHSPPEEERIISNDSRNQISTSPGHISIASLPGMWDRTITISSAGKTFSATGWQVGWCIGPPKLILPIHQLLPYVQFCPSTLMQEALARSLPSADLPFQGHSSYYDYLRNKYIRKRDMLVHTLEAAGFAVPDYDRTPGGGFFIFARIGNKLLRALPEEITQQSNHHDNNDPSSRLDWKLCKWLAEEKGLLCIPSSPFFSEEQVKKGVSDQFVRIAFCKMDDTILAAADILKDLSSDSKVRHLQQQNNSLNSEIVLDPLTQ